jgi:hypothetical protein
MQITQSKRANIPVEDQCGLMTFASFNRIIRTMKEAGELGLRDDEYVAGIVIDNDGIAFRIEKR